MIEVDLRKWFPGKRCIAFLIFPLLFIPVIAAGTGGGSDSGMNWGVMFMELLGGLALFLYGMEKMADALKAVAGEKMKVILAKLTTNRFMGAITGAFVTAVIQSSSVTTVLVVGFISAGLMSLAQSVGVIMGANIGTTITAQIVAFKVTKAALLMIAIGFGLLMGSKKEKLKQYGAMLMGLGLIFFGMSVMSGAMQPLRSYQPFLDLMISMESPAIGIFVAAAFTGLIQSSSATTGIVIVMASQGFITLPAGIALAFGANVGTCVTALLASIGKPREAIRAAVVHITFNILGVLVWIGLIDHLADFVAAISPVTEGLSGIDKLAADTPRQIANAHTIFNVANTFIFIGFTGIFARFVERVVPDKPLEEKEAIKPKYLNEALFATPSLALDRVRLEMARMGNAVQKMMTEIPTCVLDGSQDTLQAIKKMDDEVDLLYGFIVTYLGQISRKPLTGKQTDEFVHLMAAVNGIENIGDVIETDLVALGQKRIAMGIIISDITKEKIRNLHLEISRAVKLAIDSISEYDPSMANEVIGMKDNLNRLIDEITDHQAERLIVNEPNRLATYALEMDIIEKLKRVYYFAKRVSKTMLVEEEVVEEKKA